MGAVWARHAMCDSAVSLTVAAVLLQSRRTLSVAAPGHSGTAEIVTSIDVS